MSLRLPHALSAGGARVPSSESVSVKCFVKRDVHRRYVNWCSARGMSVNAWTKALVLVTIGDLEPSVLDMDATKLEELVRGR
jgi:hypothetical protein